MTREKSIADIVGEASFLWERVGSTRFLPSGTTSGATEIDRRVARWCQVAASGDLDALHRRVAWEGVEPDAVRSRLGAVEYHGPQPGWARTLQQIVGTTPADPDTAGASTPWRQLLEPAVAVGNRELRRRLDRHGLSADVRRVVAESCHRSLERQLERQLAALSRRVVHHELSGAARFGERFLAVLGLEEPSTAESAVRSPSMTHLLDEGLGGLLTRYPVLGRLVATAVDHWSESTAEFLRRLVEDLPSIQRRFGTTSGTDTAGRVVELRPALSDPHQDGRTVMALTFASGLRIVYKPKDPGLDVAFNDLLAWCNERDPALDLQVTAVLARPDYGWARYVEHGECADATATRRFYRRAGMLLCLVHVLRGTDCHAENLIAAGEHPVLIDTETLLHPEARPGEDPAHEPETTAGRGLRNSVLRTGMLPRWDYSEKGRTAYDVSALGSSDARGSALNQDEQNVPRLNGARVPADTFLGDITRGFSEMYRLLLRNRAALLAAGSPLDAFAACSSRYIFRPTRIYGLIQQSSLAPEHLRNGADFSIELEWLGSAFLGRANKPRSWPILRAELQSMAQLDVPLFRAPVAGDALPLPEDGVIEHYFREPSYDAMRAQLRALHDDDLARQLRFIRGAFSARRARSSAPDVEALPPGPGVPLTRQDLLEESTAIADAVAAQGIENADGSVSWLGLGYEPRADCFRLQELDDSLYDGRCGIAVFVAAQFLVSGASRHRSLALRALQPLRKRARACEPAARRRLASLVGIGGASGVGALIYALVTAARFLDEDMLPEARALAGWISPELIAADRRLDVMSGAAGAALGLLALYAAIGDPAVVERAVACGEHLLAQRVSHAGAPRAWRTLAEAPLTGFSHGAAGIAYALFRLYDVTGDDRFLDGALEGLAYESSVFSASHANWPDLREAGSATPARYPVQWCHGAGGIGLARLGSYRIVATPDIAGDIRAAVDAVRREPLRPVDSVCCGTLGRVETLLVAGRQLDRPDWQDDALATATAVVTGARRRGGYRLLADLPDAVDIPGFFQGAAGIGYQLLRLAHPERLPSVLLWE